MALKFDGLVEPYTGREGTEEWDDFRQKFLVLADISGWNSKDVGELSRLETRFEVVAILLQHPSPW